MARGWFGGSTDDFVYTTGPGGAVLVRQRSVTFWTAEIAGVQYTDLLYLGDATDSIPAQAGGQVPAFQGPDDDTVRAMWMDAGGTRVLLYALGTIAEEATAARDAAQGYRDEAAALGGTNNTQVSGFVTGAGPTRDALLAAFAARVPEWLPDHAYLAGELATHIGTLYQRNADGVSGAVWSGTNWTAIGGGGGGGGGWTAVDASETVKGIAELATQAETTAGADDLRIVTPLKLAQRLAALLDTNTALGASNTVVPTQAAVKAYADALIGANDAMVFKGVIDAAANPNYPAANRGDTYKVSVAGKVGGAAGPGVEVGDLVIAITDGTAAGNHATVGSAWTIVQANIDGAVVGPAASVASDFATFSGTGGKVIQDSGLSLDTDTALAANSDTRIPSQKAVKGYAHPLNKAIARRVDAVASTATYTLNVDNFDAAKITAQAAALTVANPTGTPTSMQSILLRIKDNGTARGITFGSQFRDLGPGLPTTTIVSKTMLLGFIWNSDDTKWDLIAKSQQP